MRTIKFRGKASHSGEWLCGDLIDYRGLIDKGLAIEVTGENNPYKD